METRQLRSRLVYINKPGEALIPNPFGKRKAPVDFPTHRVQQPDAPIKEFRITYKTSHSPFLDNRNYKKSAIL